MAAKITLSTIARHLDISIATVSLALRDSPLIADITKQRVKTVALDMGYIYNRRAASLRTSKSGIVGVVIHEIDTAKRFEDPAAHGRARVMRGVK